MSRSTRETRPSGTLLFYLSPSTISRLALSHRPKYRSLFAPICRSFRQSRYLPFSPSSCFVTSDCPVKLTPMSHLLGVYWNFVLFLSSSSSPSSLVVSIFSIFSFLPFSNPPLIEAGGSISTRFQNSFISRSAITDDMDDAYRDPWKINSSFDLKIITVHGFIVSPRSISYIGNLTVARQALTCVPVKPISKTNSDSRNKFLRWPISIRVLQVQLHTFQPTNHPPSTKTGEFFHPGIRVPCRIELIVYSKLEIPLFRRFYFSPIFKPACPLTISIRDDSIHPRNSYRSRIRFYFILSLSPSFLFSFIRAIYIYIFWNSTAKAAIKYDSCRLTANDRDPRGRERWNIGWNKSE